MQASVTQRVSVGYNSSEANGSSSYPNLAADGRFIVFQSEASNLVAQDINKIVDVFVYDQQTGGARHSPTLAADGHLIAFWSLANNLTNNDNNQRDILLRTLTITGQ